MIVVGCNWDQLMVSWFRFLFQRKFTFLQIFNEINFPFNRRLSPRIQQNKLPCFLKRRIFFKFYLGFAGEAVVENGRLVRYIVHCLRSSTDISGMWFSIWQELLKHLIFILSKLVHARTRLKWNLLIYNCSYSRLFWAESRIGVAVFGGPAGSSACRPNMLQRNILIINNLLIFHIFLLPPLRHNRYLILKSGVVILNEMLTWYFFALGSVSKEWTARWLNESGAGLCFKHPFRFQ